jgi:hypothetical protein
MSAQNAFVANDMRLIAREADSLHGTVTDALIAVFAI